MRNGVENTSVHHPASPVCDTQRPDPSARPSVQPSEASPITQPSSTSVPESITRAQPLAHEVGLLSLANATDPKYLGPSSGVPFARLIYASAPQSQGLPLSQENHYHTSNTQATSFPHNIEVIDLPPLAECQQYVDAFFEVALFLPFLIYDDVFVLLDDVYTFTKSRAWSHHMPITIAFAQVFLVLSLGARLLEKKLKSNFNSSGLFESGMRYVSQVKPHDSVEGIQVLLLVALDSLYNPDGLNAWHLLHTIISSCLDLGLQRQVNSK